MTLRFDKTPSANTALWFGVVFSAAFTGLIWLAGARLEAFAKLPDAGFDWYFWKLAEPTWWTRGVAWGLYFAHQFTLWGLIYYAQSRPHKYSAGLHPVNVWALGLNALFILAHFAQTHLTYDGLAQDTSIWSSQWSVIVMLVWILLMENSRRGLFFGRKMPLGKAVVAAARKYHGYIFAWAIVYTFWFHPMENTNGHLLGFLYMFLLMLQGSLFFTRVHVNKWWTFVQEVAVLVHGTLVAIDQLGFWTDQAIWPMFFFGFFGVVLITQMHGLGLSLRVRAALVAVYAALMLIVYGGLKGFGRAWEVINIPLIEYLAVFVLAGLIWLVLWLIGRVRPTAQPASSATSTATD